MFAFEASGRAPIRIAVLLAHGETVKVAMAVLELPEEIASPTYDKLMPVFSTDGKFDDKALATLGRSFVDLELLPTEPKDMRRHITEEFLPK